MNVYGDEMFEKIAQSTVKRVVCQKGVYVFVLWALLVQMTILVSLPASVTVGIGKVPFLES